MHSSITSISNPRAQRGVALVVTLVLLLVMTMIAVVATRTTTVDLKMTTNTVLSRRAFQNSEGPRTSIGKTLESHVFYRGWPTSIGGTVPTTAKFVIPQEVKVYDKSANFFEGTNGTLLDFAKEPPPYKSRNSGHADLTFALGDPSKPNNTDMTADIWVTRTAALLAGGSGAAQGSGYLGPGVGAAGAGAHVFFDLHSIGYAGGNAQNMTGADYRVLVRN